MARLCGAVSLSGKFAKHHSFWPKFLFFRIFYSSADGTLIGRTAIIRFDGRFLLRPFAHIGMRQFARSFIVTLSNVKVSPSPVI
jgi:hypothetical protein